MKSTKISLFLATVAMIGLCLYSTNMLAMTLTPSYPEPIWPSDEQAAEKDRSLELAAKFKAMIDTCENIDESNFEDILKRDFAMMTGHLTVKEVYESLASQKAYMRTKAFAYEDKQGCVMIKEMMEKGLFPDLELALQKGRGNELMIDVVLDPQSDVVK